MVRHNCTTVLPIDCPELEQCVGQHQSSKTCRRSQRQLLIFSGRRCITALCLQPSQESRRCQLDMIDRLPQQLQQLRVPHSEAHAWMTRIAALQALSDYLSSQERMVDEACSWCMIPRLRSILGLGAGVRSHQGCPWLSAWPVAQDYPKLLQHRPCCILLCA